MYIHVFFASFCVIWETFVIFSSQKVCLSFYPLVRMYKRQTRISFRLCLFDPFLRTKLTANRPSQRHSPQLYFPARPLCLFDPCFACAKDKDTSKTVLQGSQIDQNERIFGLICCKSMAIHVFFASFCVIWETFVIFSSQTVCLSF